MGNGCFHHYRNHRHNRNHLHIPLQIQKIMAAKAKINSQFLAISSERKK